MGKSALAEVFDSEGSRFPKHYVMVSAVSSFLQWTRNRQFGEWMQTTSAALTVKAVSTDAEAVVYAPPPALGRDFAWLARRSLTLSPWTGGTRNSICSTAPARTPCGPTARWCVVFRVPVVAGERGWRLTFLFFTLSSSAAQEGSPSFALVMFDTTSQPSFASCQKWLERARIARPVSRLPLMLVA